MWVCAVTIHISVLGLCPLVVMALVQCLCNCCLFTLPGLSPRSATPGAQPTLTASSFWMMGCRAFLSLKGAPLL
jgi:hypothetical protein